MTGIWKNGEIRTDFGVSYTGKDNIIGHIVNVPHSISRCCYQENATPPPRIPIVLSL